MLCTIVSLWTEPSWALILAGKGLLGEVLTQIDASAADLRMILQKHAVSYTELLYNYILLGQKKKLLPEFNTEG